MAQNEIYESAGFLFPDKIQADEAAEEEKKIYYIRSRLRREDPASMLVVYNKLIKNQILKTPVGITFLKEMQDDLKATGGIDPVMIDAIPWGATYMDRGRIKKEETVEEKNEEIERCKKRLSVMGWIVAALVISIIAMFIITMNSENPNILNYETALQNRYSSWEQELKEREKNVRQKELEISGVDE